LKSQNFKLKKLLLHILKLIYNLYCHQKNIQLEIILKLFMKVGKEGYTLVPLSMYFSGKNLKVEVGVCKGKKLWDKRETEALKAEKRDIERYERDKQK
jgi:tmRNA-binding protein